MYTLIFNTKHSISLEPQWAVLHLSWSAVKAEWKPDVCCVRNSELFGEECVCCVCDGVTVVWGGVLHVCVWVKVLRVDGSWPLLLQSPTCCVLWLTGWVTGRKLRYENHLGMGILAAARTEMGETAHGGTCERIARVTTAHVCNWACVRHHTTGRPDHWVEAAACQRLWGSVCVCVARCERNVSVSIWEYFHIFFLFLGAAQHKQKISIWDPFMTLFNKFAGGISTCRKRPLSTQDDLYDTDIRPVASGRQREEF